MSCTSRNGWLAALKGHLASRLVLSSVAVLALMASGCARTQSADGPNGLTSTAKQQPDDDDEPSRPVPPDPYKAVRYKGGRDPGTGVAQRMSADGHAPEPAPRYRSVPTLRNDAGAKPTPVATAPAPARYASAAAATGNTVEVQPGDTLYSLAARNKVSVSALMQANGLANASIRPGQKLVLPQ